VQGDTGASSSSQFKRDDRESISAIAAEGGSGYDGRRGWASFSSYCGGGLQQDLEISEGRGWGAEQMSGDEKGGAVIEEYRREVQDLLRIIREFYEIEKKYGL